MNHHSIMKLHFLTLKYTGESSDLEDPFQRENFRASLLINRAALIVGIFFYTIFGILDALLIPEYKSTTWLIRFAIVNPVIIGVFLFSFSKSFERYVNPLMSFGSILAGGGIICMIIIAPPPVNYSYYAGILLVFMWTYTFIRIPFLWASLSGWVLVALYEITAIAISHTPLAVMINNNFFFISANIIGMIACYSLEYYARRNFFLTQQIEMGKENINRVNRELEQEINERRKAEDTLRESEERYRAFVEHSSDIIALLNLEGIITYINPAVERVLGFKPEERIGAKGFELVHPDDIQFLADSFNTLARNINSPVIQGEMHLRHKDGSWRTLEAVGSNVVYNNVVEAIIVNYRDITERKKVEDALKESENKYRLLADNVNDVIFHLDMNLNYTYVSPSIKILRGYEPEEVLKQSHTDILTPSSVDLAMKTLSDVMEQEKIKHAESTESRTIQLEMRRKDGTTVWTEVKFSFIRDENQRPVGILGVTRDITERKQAEDELRESEHRYQKLSIIDDLTQLYNSRHFFAQLEREIERSNRYEQPLTLLLLDLDKFKDFNDTYGHVEGDNVLSRLGQVVKRCLRETDFAYRYGGEEFTIMLPMTTSEEGIVTAKRIQMELRKEGFSPVMDQEVYVTVSIGVAQYKPKEDMKVFVNRVDQLMYQAKKNGRDKICSES